MISFCLSPVISFQEQLNCFINNETIFVWVLWSQFRSYLCLEPLQPFPFHSVGYKGTINHVYYFTYDASNEQALDNTTLYHPVTWACNSCFVPFIHIEASYVKLAKPQKKVYHSFSILLGIGWHQKKKKMTKGMAL